MTTRTEAFANIVAALPEAARAVYGAKRLEIGGTHYWLLKPNARPGEPIAL